MKVTRECVTCVNKFTVNEINNRKNCSTTCSREYQDHARKIYSQKPHIKARKRLHQDIYQKNPDNIAKAKIRNDTPENKAKLKTRRNKPENIARLKAQRNTPEYKAKRKAIWNKPENKAKRKAQHLIYIAKVKAMKLEKISEKRVELK